jgi:transcription-repair coupling factor (superfamily II helicase)
MANQDDHINTLKQLLAKDSEEVFSRLYSAADRRIYNLSLPHLASLLLHEGKRVFVVEDTSEHAGILCNDIQYLAAACNITPPSFDYFPPPSSPEHIGERARIVRKLSSGETAGIITSADAVASGFSAGMLENIDLHLTRGMNIDRVLLEEALVRLGYRKVSIVMEKGEYAERGWLFDIYPSTEELPVRVELFGDEIDLIRTFDIETQRSVKKVNELIVYPAAESLQQDSDGDIDMSGNLLSCWNGDFFINAGAGLDLSGLDAFSERMTVLSHLAITGEGIDSGELSISGLGIMPGELRSVEDIAKSLEVQNKKTIIVLPSAAQLERLKDILSASGLVAPVISAEDTCSYEGSLFVTQGRLSGGLHLSGLLLLTGREIFGEQPAYRPIKRSKVSKLLLTMDDLKPGDFVVHRDHGIGKFVGLHRERIEGFEEDIITLEYAGSDRLYIPFQGIDRLSKYSSGEGNVPVLDRLGSKRWQNTKKRVKKSVKEMAEKLLKLYAERRVSRGYLFSDDTPMHAEFDDFFQYEETEDQIKATEAIRKHMQSDQPMDMLICGDVGYGKTEVALKAAFRAVYDGKQVAVLVPTTLLAEQHYRTFRSRFSAFPVRIDYLSRFKGSREAKETIASLAKGEVDVIIGTHMLLGKTVQFQDLGLIIIDEEHRFGVAQKERLKELRKGVDIITLTATPIPRTLHMSLSGIREMETIETPPEERLAVRSAVSGHNDKTIREAIERELKREGQIFFVHNRIHDIEKVVAYLRRLAPGARIAYAHGQMAEHQLEKIMLAFLNRDIDLLVSTAIISSGLDIPTANTIIIDRADTFGLSDLYQLRGRVGRGNMQAYAYFLVPGEDIMTDDAKKRLQAIQEMSYLGAGFRLALKDLEIRGAGNLLGGEQSGHIYKVGFDMYMEMLEKAVAELKGGEVIEDIEPQIKLPIAAFIPEEYVPDITLRLSLYKRFTSLRSNDEMKDFSAEMTDRFGRMPVEVKNLLHVIRIKLFAKRLFISKVVFIGGYCRFIFRGAEEYQLPEGFAERLLNKLFAMQKTMGKGRVLRFLQNGFEFRTEGIPAEKSMEAVEEMLKGLDSMMQEAEP